METKKTNSKFKCPKCSKIMYGWRNASKHAEEKKHWGNYNTKQDASLEKGGKKR